MVEVILESAEGMKKPPHCQRPLSRDTNLYMICILVLQRLHISIPEEMNIPSALCTGISRI
jgi:hypothetical protein